MGHQPEQLQIGFTMLNTVDLIGSRSTAGHALRLQPCLASMKTSFGSHTDAGEEP